MIASIPSGEMMMPLRLIWPIIKQRLPVEHDEAAPARCCTIGFTKGSRRIRYFEGSTVSTGGSTGLIAVASGTRALAFSTVGAAAGPTLAAAGATLAAAGATLAAAGGAETGALAGVTFALPAFLAAAGAATEPLAGVTLALTAFLAAAAVCARQLAPRQPPTHSMMHANKISRSDLIVVNSYCLTCAVVAVAGAPGFWPGAVVLVGAASWLKNVVATQVATTVSPGPY